MAENDDGTGDGNRRLRLLPNRCGSFTGSTLCNMLGNGIYRFPFPVYRETTKYGNNISMANNGFEHPCVLSVRDGVGMLQLKAVDLSAQSCPVLAWVGCFARFCRIFPARHLEKRRRRCYNEIGRGGV